MVFFPLSRMSIIALRVRALHKASDHRVPLPDLCRHCLRLLLDERLHHKADTSADVCRHLPLPFHQCSRRCAQYKRKKPL